MVDGATRQELLARNDEARRREFPILTRGSDDLQELIGQLTRVEAKLDGLTSGGFIGRSTAVIRSSSAEHRLVRLEAKVNAALGVVACATCQGRGYVDRYTAYDMTPASGLLLPPNATREECGCRVEARRALGDGQQS